MSAYALISDIHSNIDALEAVLRDIDQVGVTDIRCLGDIVGYGPAPTECVDLVMERARLSVLGNHDEALVHGAYGFHLRAQQAVDWTRDVLKPGPFSGLKVRRRWSWLAGLPLRHDEGPDLFVHGSPRQPTSEYLLVMEVGFGPTEKYEEVFASTERFVFVGHSHQPCVITNDYEVRVPEQLDGRFALGDLPGDKAIINVGSVGQPRDNDPRACWVLVEDGPTGPVISWRRVVYDVAAAQARFAVSAALHPSLADRLAAGT